jgi:hypothetical protein
MSTVKSTKDFLRTLGLLANSKNKDHEHDSSDEFSPQDIAKELFSRQKSLLAHQLLDPSARLGKCVMMIKLICTSLLRRMHL